MRSLNSQPVTFHGPQFGIPKAEHDALKAENAKLRELLSAVTSREGFGIECHDVVRTNWFDARDAILNR